MTLPSDPEPFVSATSPAATPPTPAKPAKPAKAAKPKVDWWEEIKSILWLVLAVLGFHSLIAKPFFIPSESMMPGLLTGDQLVVTKFPYGYSFVSPTFHLLPYFPGRLFGSVPRRGDVVIAVPPGVKEDYIKRVIGLPGDTVEVRGGVVILNGKPIKRSPVVQRLVPIDANTPCDERSYPGLMVRGEDGRNYCQLPVIRETLPEGRSYDTIDLGDYPEADYYGPVKVPANHVFLMGDNRDHSADSRFSVERSGLGGPVPWENIGGRAELITFSLDGTQRLFNPLTWPGALRGGRAGTSLHPSEARKPAPDPAR